MGTNRLEAFSDGVMAVAITIMVLELKVPEGTAIGDLLALAPKFLSYILSFIYVGIYWSNHHNLMHAVDKVNGSNLLANLHLLFWLSLIPFATAWMGEHHLAPLPTAVYGVVLLMCATAWFILQSAIIRQQGPDSPLKKAVGKDLKGNVSAAAYIVAIVSAFWLPTLSACLYALVALVWIVPDRRFGRALKEELS